MESSPVSDRFYDLVTDAQIAECHIDQCTPDEQPEAIRRYKRCLAKIDAFKMVNIPRLLSIAE